MGAQVGRVHDALRECGGENLHTSVLTSLDFNEVQEFVLRVVDAPIDDSRGACLTGYNVGDELKVVQFSTVNELNPLGWRHQEKTRPQWPHTYRFQVPKRSWQAMVVPDNSAGSQQVCLLQMAASPDERTRENAQFDVEDSKVAAVYAQRFNLHQQNTVAGMGMADPKDSAAVAATSTMDDETALIENGTFPTIKVAAPVACEVIASGYPSMVPVGAICTLAPYAEKRVQEYVFDGQSDEFSELPQAYFHYAAFTSGGKEYVCDIQGVEDDDGSFLIVDPCILKADLPGVRDLIGAVANVQSEPSKNGPTVERFDTLHPKCTQACRVFDPQRRSAMRNGKVGMCGMGACGLRFAK